MSAVAVSREDASGEVWGGEIFLLFSLTSPQSTVQAQGPTELRDEKSGVCCVVLCCLPSLDHNTLTVAPSHPPACVSANQRAV